MKVSNLLFKPEMILALLREIEQPGTGKTNTRRLFKLPSDLMWYDELGGEKEGWVCGKTQGSGWWNIEDEFSVSPWGGKGDLIWCRETIRIGDDLGKDWREHYTDYDSFIIYEDGQSEYIVPDGYEIPRYAKPVYHGDLKDADYWRSWDSVRSIHMPRWASRITLELTDVRVHRLQSISDSDAKAEGVVSEIPSGRYMEDGNIKHAHVELFKQLWDSINAKSGNNWNSNPWVWALSFTPHLMNIDRYLESLNAQDQKTAL